MKRLFMLEAGTTWLLMVRTPTSQDDLGWEMEKQHLMGAGPSPGPRGSPSSAQPSSTGSDLSTLILEGNPPNLEEHLSFPLPWTKAARTRDSSRWDKVWLQVTLCILVALQSGKGILLD